MTAGGVLAHAKLGASGSKKWLACTMAPAMEDKIPDEEDSSFAAEGTYAHGLLELLLRCYISGNDGADVEAAEAYCDPGHNPDAERFYSKDMLSYVTSTVDFAVERYETLVAEHGRGNVLLLTEQRLDFSRWVPEGFGTADVVIIAPGHLVVIDLKYGAGVYVGGKNNSQIRLYALGAYDRFSTIWDFDTVEVWIHQPRMDNVSGEVLSIQDIHGILQWAEDLVVPRARIAWAALNGDRAEARFSPGTHCSEGFCKARFVCAARARSVLELAEMPHTMSDPDSLTVEQLEQVLDRVDAAVKWASDTKAYLVRQATQGRVKLQRYRLVEGRTYRQITDTTAAAEALMREGFAAKDIYREPELVGLGQLEKLVGVKKLPEVLGDLLTKPAGNPTLAPLEADRRAVEPRPVRTAQLAFGDLPDE